MYIDTLFVLILPRIERISESRSPHVETYKQRLFRCAPIIIVLHLNVLPLSDRTDTYSEIDS